MYTHQEAKQFEIVVEALAQNGVINSEVSRVGIEAVYAKLNNENLGGELLSRNEASRFLKCSVKTIDRMLDEGKLSRIRTSKRAIRIQFSELKRMIAI